MAEKKELFSSSSLFPGFRCLFTNEVTIEDIRRLDPAWICISNGLDHYKFAACRTRPVSCIPLLTANAIPVLYFARLYRKMK